tara:strand:- start:5065 stop:5370 length:306 start_codon:yes stop_codon:yes gene_type:complete
LYDEEALKYVRFSGTEELAQLTSLRNSGERRAILKLFSCRKNRSYSAVVLHNSRRDTLVQLLDFPLKTIVHPIRRPEIGEPVELRLSQVDLWKKNAHFLVK